MNGRAERTPKEAIAQLAAALHAKHGSEAIHIDGRLNADPEVIDRIFGARIFVQPAGCWRWSGMMGNQLGHRKLSVHDRPQWVHRIAYALVHGPIPAGLVVRHTCDMPDCVNPGHLLLGSQADNIRDAVGRGRSRKPPVHRGASNPKARLSDGEVAALREASARGASQHELARRFGVSQSSVWRIVHGKVRAT